MKPMTTISFPTGEYVVVPVDPTLEMVCAAENFIGRHAYKKAIAAVPDQLPGVVVHEGEPCAFVNGDELLSMNCGNPPPDRGTSLSAAGR